LSVKLLRHTIGCTLAFGSANVRSLSPSKLDDLLVEFKHHSLDAMLLCETWHDADSVSIRRLRAEGFGVVERARPRQNDASLKVNHGGVAIVVAPKFRVKAVEIGSSPSTFECTAARITSGQSSCLVAVFYRPGSSAVTGTFFTELADVIKHLLTFIDPLVLAGDVNIRLERESDPNTVAYGELMSAYGMVQLVQGATHDQGGTLDVVCTRDDLPLPTVCVYDNGISDHRLLCWRSCLQRPPPVYTSSTRRTWRSFDQEVFRKNLQMSVLCDNLFWNKLDGEALVLLYNNTLESLLNDQIPVRSTTCRRRPSNAWFNDECRKAKQSLRILERAARQAGELSDSTAVLAWRDERRRYLALVRRTRSTFWTSRVESERFQPRRLWQSFDHILGRGRGPPADIDASTLHRFFDEKVNAVRAATSSATPPVFTAAPAGCELRMFTPVTEADVIELLKSLPDKQCSSDPMPTWLLKANSDILAPFLCRLFCESLESGTVSLTLKSAYITPILKKSDLDPTDPKSYRPISNLSVLSKMMERLVSKQLVTYLKENNLLPDLQSAYKVNHSTETAVLKVLSDILLALDSGDIGMLMMLDLSAAFDSVDHATLLKRLTTSYGLKGSVINWFRSYLSDRTQCVHSSKTRSSISTLLYGVPQGSVLGPILFLLYVADVLQLIKRHQLLPHAYADDTQIYGFCNPSDADVLQERVAACFDEVSEWTAANRLQLNPSKTEVLWCASTRRQHLVTSTPIQLGSASVSPVSTVRDLGFHINSDVTLTTHVSATVRACFSVLRQIRSVQRSLTRDALIVLLRALVISKVDYCCSALVGVSGQQINRLQSVLNAAARLVFAAHKFDHVTPYLRDLHWLKITERIQFRLCVLAFRCLHGTAPAYLANSLHLVSDNDARRRLRSADALTLVVPATRRSTLGDRAFPVAAATAWNTLPSAVRHSPSLSVFCKRLKTTLFSRSFPPK
jgi:hypothetical protein